MQTSFAYTSTDALESSASKLNRMMADVSPATSMIGPYSNFSELKLGINESDDNDDRRVLGCTTDKEESRAIAEAVGATVGE